jgi:hypothetical protein
MYALKFIQTIKVLSKKVVEPLYRVKKKWMVGMKTQLIYALASGIAVTSQVNFLRLLGILNLIYSLFYVIP